MPVSSDSRTRSSSATPLSPVSTWGWSSIPIGVKIFLIPLLFVFALFGLQYYTSQSLDQIRSDARIVDISARQRVLSERIQKELRDEAAGIQLKNSQGKDADWRDDVTLFNQTADDLIKGGDIVFNADTGERGVIPPAQSAEVRDQLRQQKAMMNQVYVAAGTYLNAPPNSAQRRARLEELSRLGNTLSQQANATSKLLTRDSEEALHRALQQQRVAAVTIGALGFFFSVITALQIIRPMDAVVRRARDIGSGDLRGDALPVRGTDEVGQLSAAFNAMQEGLRDVAAKAQAAVESLSAASAEILASAQQQAAGSGEQAAAVQQTTTTMEEISRSGTQIAEKARQVASTAESASSASEAGIHAVQDASRSMITIQQQAQAVAENVVSLSERTRAIGDIINTVNEIAEQSHLLALNAAIEAAGAGEQGRRFSVVADEMKHLADQSRDATVQVRSILSDIQKQIHTAVMVTEESVKRTEDGKRQSDTAEATIRRMSGGIIDSVNAFQQIVAAANQQQIGFEQVTQAAQQIRAAVDQTTVGIRQMEAAAVNVNQMSDELRNAIEVYRL